MRTTFACPLLLALSPLWLSTPTRASVPPTGRAAADPGPLPLDRIALSRRALVAELIAHPTVHHQTVPRVFPADHRLYQTLLDSPVLTLALWKELGLSGASLVQESPLRYRGEDGSGSSAVWEFVYRSPTIRIILGRTSYQGVLFNHQRIETTTLLVLRTGYYREVNHQAYVEHKLETYIRVETAGWRALARTLNTVADRLLEDRMQEALLFISLMCQYVQNDPSWAAATVLNAREVAGADQRRFVRVLQALPAAPSPTGDRRRPDGWIEGQAALGR